MAWTYLQLFLLDACYSKIQVVYLVTLDVYKYLRQNELEAFQDKTFFYAATKLLKTKKKLDSVSLFLTC